MRILKKNNSFKISKTLKDKMITFGMVIGFFLILQILIYTGQVSSLIQGILVPLCTYSILAVSLNLTVGILGELSLGHAGFMCVGAFASAFFSKVMQEAIPISGVRFTIAILIGACCAGLFGLIIGIPVLRLRGDYLAIVTLAFGEIIKNLIGAVYLGKDSLGWHFSLSNPPILEDGGDIYIKGAQGITGTPNDSSFFIGIILLIITLAIVLNLIHSRAGRAIMAVRDNTIAAEATGIPVTKYKLMAFAISAGLAGVAGALYSHNLATLSPRYFNYNMSILVLVFVVLGGIGNMRGSIISAVILTLLPELLRGRGFDDYRMLIYAIVLIAMMLFNWAPACIAWKEKHSIKNLLKNKKTKEAK